MHVVSQNLKSNSTLKKTRGGSHSIPPVDEESYEEGHGRRGPPTPEEVTIDYDEMTVDDPESRETREVACRSPILERYFDPTGVRAAGGRSHASLPVDEDAYEEDHGRRGAAPAPPVAINYDEMIDDDPESPDMRKPLSQRRK